LINLPCKFYDINDERNFFFYFISPYFSSHYFYQKYHARFKVFSSVSWSSARDSYTVVFIASDSRSMFARSSLVLSWLLSITSFNLKKFFLILLSTRVENQTGKNCQYNWSNAGYDGRYSNYIRHSFTD